MADVGFPSRSGQVLGTGSVTALFLKMFSGEVLTANANMTLTRSLVRTKNITEGESYQFPVTGTVEGTYHVPGENIITQEGSTTIVAKYLQELQRTQKIIYLDNIFVSPVLIQKIDQAMNHYEDRRIYTEALGSALARKEDRSVIQCVAGDNGAGASATISGDASGWGSGGISLTETTFETNLANMKYVIAQAAQNMDERNVPREGRYMILRPAAFTLLASDLLTNSSLNNPGSDLHMRQMGLNVGTRQFTTYQGFTIFQSNQIAAVRALGDVTAADSGQRGTDYTGDFAGLVGIFFHRDGVATLNLIGEVTMVDWMPEYLAWLAQAHYAKGHGVLRPDYCGAIFDGT